MHRTFVTYTISFFCLISLSFQQNECLRPLKGLSKIENFQTSHLQIISTVQKDRYYPTNVTYTQNHIKGKIDVSLSITYITNYLDKNGVDFSVRTVVRESNFMVLLAININARWTKTHIHYIVSSRDDFKCGTFTASDSSLLQMTPKEKSKKVRLTNSLPNPLWALPRARVIAYSFISGIKCQDTDFSMKIFQIQTSYINQSISVVVNIVGNKKPVEMLYLSFFAFSANGKATAKQYPPNFDFFKLSVTGKALSTDPYGVSGMTAVNSNNLKQLINKANNAIPPKRLLQSTNHGRRILAQLTGNLSQIIAGFDELQFIIYKKAFEIQDVDIVSEEFLIPILTKNGGVCMNFNECIRQSGEVATFKNGSKACIQCSAYNKTFNSETEQCECKDKFIQQKDKCISIEDYCGVGTLFINGTCFQLIKTKIFCQRQKNEVYDQVNGKCVCSPQTKLITGLFGKQACLPQCMNGAFQNISTLSCECPVGLYLKQKNKCVKCSSSSQEWDIVKQQCMCRTGTTQTKNGACLRCPPNAVVNFQKNSCQCLPGYIGKGLICRKDQTETTQQPKDRGAIILNSQNNKP